MQRSRKNSTHLCLQDCETLCSTCTTEWGRPHLNTPARLPLNSELHSSRLLHSFSHYFPSRLDTNEGCELMMLLIRTANNSEQSSSMHFVAVIKCSRPLTAPLINC